MTRESDDEALRWAGDDDATLIAGEEPALAPGWQTVGSAGRVEEASATPDAAAEATEAPRQIGSALLVFYGILGGVYLLYSIGWAVVAGRVHQSSADPVADVMFTLGTWLAVLAPVGWFALALWVPRLTARSRILWLVGGAIALVPLPFVLGTGDGRMTAEATPTAEVREPAAVPLWLRVSLAIVFGLFYAYDVWEAVGNLVGIAQFAGALETAISPLGWVVLVGSVLLPIVLFAVAFVLGRRRSALLQAALYVAGLAVSAAWYLDIISVFGIGNLLV